MNNFTDYSSSWVDSNNSIDCNDLTNNGLYLIFVGYVLPLLSPKVRSYGIEILSTIKNLGNVAGSIVSLTEFGFEKVQELSNNGEMINFIQRVCMVNDLNVLPNDLRILLYNLFILYFHLHKK